MKGINVSLAILGVLALAMAAPAQCNPPGLETFEGATNGSTSTSCSAIPPTISPGVLPPGWTTNLTVSNVWRVDNGGTPSSGTGPLVDHTLASLDGKYLYLEASGSCGSATAILNAPCFDATGVVNPAVEFWYHMFGDNQGTLELQELDGGGVWNTIFSVSGQQQFADSEPWKLAQALVNPVAGQVTVRFVGIPGGGFESDMAFDDVRFGTVSTREYQDNDPKASLDIDGVSTDTLFNAAVLSKSYLSGLGCAPPTTSLLTLSSALVGNGYELALSPVPLAPLSGFGRMLPDGQIINVDLTSPLFWMNGGPVPNFMALPSFFGASASVLMATLAPTSNLDVSAQAIVLDATALLGFRLSQGIEWHATYINGVQGPAGDDSSLTVDLGSCGLPPVVFYGVSYPSIHISSNGRVMLASPDTNAAPDTQTEFLTDGPMVGQWADMDAEAGGVIAVTSPGAGLVRVDYIGVPYWGYYATLNTFGVQFDTVTNDVQIDGILGVLPHPAVGFFGMLGISAGSGVVTDPGLTLFAVGGPNPPANPTDAIYNWGPSGTLGGGVDTLLFTPDLVQAPNYSWTGF